LSAPKSAASTASSLEKTEIFHGSDKVIDAILQFSSKTKNGIDACVDYTRPSLAIKINQLKKSFVDAKNRGVRLRCITEITKENIIYCKELLDIVNELRLIVRNLVF
jgi:two-component system sensor histidine kinase VicK